MKRTLSFAALALLLISAQGAIAEENGTGADFSYSWNRSGGNNYSSSKSSTVYAAPYYSNKGAANKTKVNPLTSGYTGTMIINQNGSNKSSSKSSKSSSKSSSSSNGFKVDPNSKESVRYQKYMYEKRQGDLQQSLDYYIDNEDDFTAQEKVAKKKEISEIIARIERNSSKSGGGSDKSGNFKGNDCSGGGCLNSKEHLDFNPDSTFTETDIPANELQNYSVKKASPYDRDDLAINKAYGWDKPTAHDQKLADYDRVTTQLREVGIDRGYHDESKVDHGSLYDGNGYVGELGPGGHVTETVTKEVQAAREMERERNRGLGTGHNLGGDGDDDSNDGESNSSHDSDSKGGNQGGHGM